MLHKGDLYLSTDIQYKNTIRPQMRCIYSFNPAISLGCSVNLCRERICQHSVKWYDFDHKICLVFIYSFSVQDEDPRILPLKASLLYYLSL